MGLLLRLACVSDRVGARVSRDNVEAFDCAVAAVAGDGAPLVSSGGGVAHVARARPVHCRPRQVIYINEASVQSGAEV